MNQELRFWLGFWLIIGSTLSSIVWAITYYRVTSERQYIEAGFRMETVPIAYQRQWTKGEKE